ncbi:MAG: phytanoyl-CoA dioxygenase family protein [Acidimicrobiia bacterium]|nr:phytanoyl-CoA dioxygenase family protein [Acidimicrobiia bacterium]
MGSSKVLSDDEVSRYRQDGYLIPEFRLPRVLVDRLSNATRQLVADRPELIDHSIVGPHLPGGGIHGLHTDGTFLDVATDETLLDAVEQLCAPDLILWNSLMLYKRAERGPKVPWHRDAFTSVIDPIATTSVWIAVTESTVDNGCLRFVPGSHRTGDAGEHDATPRPGEMFSATLDPASFDASSAVDAELEPGQVVFFDVFTVHGSQPNNGTRPRAGFACRYMPGTSIYHHDRVEVRDQPGYGHESRALMLVRGEDRTGRNDFARGHARVNA